MQAAVVNVAGQAPKYQTFPDPVAGDGAVLRAIDLTMVGSGFGAARIELILAAIPNLFASAPSGALKIAVEQVPLADVEGAWNRIEKGRRIVFTI
ncbi:MAG TPA: hypothetical protein VMT38_00025 [Terracidiphilus sp.]|nr:hypothetical protein [Terracidiphilus sp.]